MSLQRVHGEHDLDNMEGEPFPPTRFILHDNPYIYYKACRSSSEDVLSCVTSSRRPLVLLLAPGDPHSLLYTLYLNFDPEFSGRFEGATFLVNENWSLVQARDVLIFYLCLQMPQRMESHEGLHLCATIWAILFSTTLMPDHVEILKDAVKVLLRYSTSLEAWDSPCNQLRKVVKFRNEDTLRAVGQHWRRWLKDKPEYVPNFKDMMEGRSSFLSQQHGMSIVDVVTRFPHYCLPHLIGLSADIIPDRTQQQMKLDFVNFLSTGTTFAEEVLHLPINKEIGMVTNCTFYDGTANAVNNTPYYGRIPFLAFFHSFLFSPNGCRRGNVPRTLSEKLPVPDHQFQDQPLHSNSVQQLFLWLSASSRALKKSASLDSPNVTFVFECCDPLRILLRLQAKPDTYESSLGVTPLFHAVHTFELFDILSPPDLVFNSLPLLQSDHFLIAVVVDSHTLGHTSEQYLGTVFGIHPQLFAVLYGMRCVGVEGADSDGTTSRQTAWELDPSFKQRDIRTFVFQRIMATPYVVTSIAQFESAPHALLSAIHSTTYNFPSNHYSVTMTSETIASTVLAFIHQLEDSVRVLSYDFWEPFSEIVRTDPNIRYLRQSLQAAFIVHKIHIHLTVDRRNCPLCKNSPISSFISIFSVKIKDPSLAMGVTLGLFVNKEGVGTTLLPDLKKTQMVQTASLRRDDRQQYWVDFYFPREFAEESSNYCLTIIKFSDTAMLGRKIGIPSVFKQVPMKDMKVEGSRYYFRNIPQRQKPLYSNFGKMERHNCDCSRVHSELDVCHHLTYMLKSTSIVAKTDFPGRQQLRLSVRDQYMFDIYYPYPIDFKRLEIEYYSQTDVVVIDAPRNCFTFANHKPMFVVVPTNRLFLPAAPVFPPRPVTRDYMALQISLKEDEALRSKESVKIHPIVRLKSVVKDLFTLASTQCRFLHIKSSTDDLAAPKLQGMIVIHDEVVDLETKSPAVDLSYYFLVVDDNNEELLTVWKKLASEHSARSLIVPDKYLDHVKDMFEYYTKRTCPIYTDNNHTSLCRIKILRKHNIDHYFSRAVIFPFYASPDKQVQNPFGLHQQGVTTNEEAHKVARSIAEMMNQKPGVVHTHVLDRLERDRMKAASYVSAAGDTNSVDAMADILQYIKGAHFIKGVEIIGGKAYVKLADDDDDNDDQQSAAAHTSTRSWASKEKHHPQSQKDRLKQKLKKKVKEKSKLGTSECATTPEVKVKKDTTKKVGGQLTNTEKKRSETVVVETKKKEMANSGKTASSWSDKSKSIAAKEPCKESDMAEKTTTNGPLSQGAEPQNKPHPRGSSKSGGKTKGKCTNCGQSSDQMKKCARCGGPRYCSRECQKQHWKKHKPDCIAEDRPPQKKVEKTTPTSEDKSWEDEREGKEHEEKDSLQKITEASCFTCGKQSENLKRCKCIQAIYCDVQCQRKDWPRHKLTCSAVPQKN